MIDSSTFNEQCSSDSISLEAASWIAQLDGGKLSTSDRLAFAEWVSRSPRHSHEIHKLALMWGDVDTVIDDCLLTDPSSLSMSQLIKAWFSEYPKQFFSTLALATTALFVMTFLLLPSVSVQKMNVYSVNKGESLIKTLDDGTIIHLNTNSIIEIQYSETSRDIRLLSGEVFFDVVTDPNRPFRVFVGDQQVVAVGTAFIIRIDIDIVDVTVTEGTVYFNHLDNIGDSLQDILTNKPIIINSQIVSAGNKVTTKDNNKIVKTTPLMVEQQTAWRKGELVFVNTSLVDVVAEINRYSTIDITMEPNLRNRKIGGRFLTSDVERIIKAMELTMNIRVNRFSDGAIFLSEE